MLNFICNVFYQFKFSFLNSIRLCFMLCTFFALLCSCNNHDSKYVCFNQIEYISEFPKNITLNKTDPQEIDLMGCVDLIGNDSLLIFKMMGTGFHWKVYSFANWGKGVNLLKKGEGPNEFVNMPSNEYFYGSDCRVWIPSKSQMVHINLSKSFQKEQLCLDSIYRLPINGTAVNCVFTQDSTYFAVLFQRNSFQRILLDKCGKCKISKNLQLINDVTVQNDLNALSAVRRYEPQRKKVVEGMLHLNQINLYSLEDSTFAKTICVGDKLSNLNILDNSSKKEWTKFYGCIVTHPDYFAAIYFNAKRKDFFNGMMDSVAIHFFNWDGDPLLNLTIPYAVETFFIHKNKDLYLLSVHGEKETLYKYDLETILRDTLNFTSNIKAL